ncbi:MAG: response regulator transcription factor, partial [Mesorhizobium sp.]
MAAAIKLAIIDDHPLFREGVVRTLEQIGGFEIVAQGSSRDDALRISEDQQLDILLMDISVPGGGLSAIEP